MAGGGEKGRCGEKRHFVDFKKNPWIFFKNCGRIFYIKQ